MFLWNLPLNFRYDWEERVCSSRGGGRGEGGENEKVQMPKIRAKIQKLKSKKTGTNMSFKNWSSLSY